jgi:SAM-dependent methyltransferase
MRSKDAFTRFEHAGWQRVADKYDSVSASLTQQFIPHLISAVRVSAGMTVLDVACGLDYVSASLKELGSVPTGIDFSEKMIVSDAIEAHGELDVGLPEGPPHYLFGEREECRPGFDGSSMSYQTCSLEWHVPTASYFSKLNATPVSAGPDFLRAIRQKPWMQFGSRSKTKSGNMREMMSSSCQ